MKKSLLVLTALVCLPLCATAADDLLDAQDLVFLGDVRPVRLRLRVSVEGKPYSTLMDAYLRELFAYFDRDRDAVLSKVEAARAPNARSLAQMLQQAGAYFYNSTPNFQVKPEEMDLDEDGEITPDEFLGYYRRSGINPLRVLPGYGRGFQADALTDALFRHLDADGDGKLTEYEVSKAPSLLVKLDQEEDDLLTMQDLLPVGFNPYGNRGVVVNPVGGGMMAPAAVGGALPDSSPFVIISGDDATARLTQRVKLGQQLLERYDEDKDQRLRRAEIGLDKEAFRQLDTNKDGNLDAMELIRFVYLPPELELSLKLGKLSEKDVALSVVEASKTKELAKAVRPSGTNWLIVSLDGAHVDVRRTETVRNASVQTFYLQQFKAADVKKKGYLEAADVEARQYQYLKSLFTVADRDEDGKLTESELTDWYDLQDRSRLHLVTLTLTDDGRDFFSLLDTNRDGRLGLRELRSLWSRLEPLDKEKTGLVARTALPRQFNLSLTLGVDLYGGRQFALAPNPYVPATGGTASGRGPVWFRKMDRNGDGDVSPREWLGTPAQFAKLDLDGDGLISLEEAEAANAVKP